jgi:hypothetical protein
VSSARLLVVLEASTSTCFAAASAPSFSAPPLRCMRHWYPSRKPTFRVAPREVPAPLSSSPPPFWRCMLEIEMPASPPLKPINANSRNHQIRLLREEPKSPAMQLSFPPELAVAGWFSPRITSDGARCSRDHLRVGRGKGSQSISPFVTGGRRTAKEYLG